jgi:hypothetical protein
MMGARGKQLSFAQWFLIFGACLLPLVVFWWVNVLNSQAQFTKMQMQPTYSWKVARDDTRAFHPASIWAYGPEQAPPATLSSLSSTEDFSRFRVEITSDYPINAGFLPYEWEEQILAVPGLLDANWKSAQCLQQQMLHAIINCKLDPSLGKQAFVIQDARQRIDNGSMLVNGVWSYVTHDSSALKNATSDNRIRVQFYVPGCVQNCEQQK